MRPNLASNLSFTLLALLCLTSCVVPDSSIPNKPLKDPATPETVLAGKEFWDSNGNKVTGTMANRSLWNLDTTAFSGSGYYESISTSLSSSDICTNKQIFGVTGTANCGYSFTDFMVSSVHRTMSTQQITLSQEQRLLPSGYREIPQILKDDDGYTGVNINYSTVPDITCGTTQFTVEERITDCAEKNPKSATWDGSINGNAGQAVWKLVTYTEDEYEIWRDERTKLIWSDKLGTTNWCKASGSSGGGPHAEADPNGYCSSASYQDQNTPETWCVEGAGINTPSFYDSQKGQMHAASTAPAIQWRLPTIYDWEQAEIDGIRFVLPSIAERFWSSTVLSYDRKYAWTYWGDDAARNAALRTTNLSVRCVGR